MNTEELQQLVARARSAEEGPSCPPSGLFERANRARRRHRQAVVGWLLVGAALASVVAFLVSPSWRSPDEGVRVPETGGSSIQPSRAADQTAPAELQVTCTDRGPEVSATTVAAQPDGVRLIIGSTLQRGSYLTYRSTTTDGGPSGGDRLPRHASVTYAFPPGEVLLGCAVPPGMDEIGTVTIEVVDPRGYWRANTLEDQGCVLWGSGPSWVRGLVGTGRTAEEAVDQVLANFAAELGRHYTAAPALTGYTDADTQTWVAADDGTPALTIRVTRSSNGYDAGPDAMCGRHP